MLNDVFALLTNESRLLAWNLAFKALIDNFLGGEWLVAGIAFIVGY